MSFTPYTLVTKNYYLNLKSEEFCLLEESMDQNEDFEHFPPFIDVTYGYDFIREGAWIPGINISLFVKPFPVLKRYSEYYIESAIDGGIDLDVYLKAFISKFSALFLKVGFLSNSESVHHLEDYEFEGFLSLGFQGYL